MSDVIPTDEDIRAAILMFKDRASGLYDVEKIGHETARHRRVLNQNAKTMNNVDRCLNGDEATGFKGIMAIGSETKLLSEQTHSMVCEMYETHTGKRAKTDTALVKKDSDPFIERAKGVIIFLAWAVTTIIALASIIF